VIDVGRFPRGIDDLAEQIAADVSSAGFICRADPAVMRLKYGKLMASLGNALQVVAEVGLGNPRAKALAEQLWNEARACFKAAGIEFADRDEYQQIVSRHYHVADQNLRGETWGGGLSTWQSLVKGHTRLEVDYFNGEIELLGKLHGIPTPYNAALQQLAQQTAYAGNRSGLYTLDDIDALARQLAPAAAGSVR
jgi:2-dehydropantoate 2-reductase